MFWEKGSPIRNQDNYTNKNEKNIRIDFKKKFKVGKFEFNENHLTVNQKSESDKLISKYESIFAKDKYDIGLVNGYEACIDLWVDEYCVKRPYSSREREKEIEKQIQKLLKKDLIEESHSPFAASVTLALKIESGLCIDFRYLITLLIP